ncbi:MAG: DNA starvation/stationary phase protection protein Dps [Myxococcota bacterium]
MGKAKKIGTTIHTLHHTRHDLAPEVRAQMVELLNQQMADTFDLYSQTKQAHWNVKGMHFQQLHTLFDELAGGILGFIDMLAERAAILGGNAYGTARMAAAKTRLPEFPTLPQAGAAYVVALAERYAHLAKTTRAAMDTADEAGDADTADLLTEVSRALDKSLWFLEAHIQES